MTSEAVSQEKSLKSNFVHKFSRKKNVDKVDRKPKLNTSLVTGTYKCLTLVIKYELTICYEFLNSF